MKGRASKNKGSRYEVELAHYLNARLRALNVSRAPLSGGGAHLGGVGRADLLGTPAIWIEAKRTERFTPHAAMLQAVAGTRAARTPDLPVVVNRRNRQAHPHDRSEAVSFAPLFPIQPDNVGDPLDPVEQLAQHFSVFAPCVFIASLPATPKMSSILYKSRKQMTRPAWPLPRQ